MYNARSIATWAAILAVTASVGGCSGDDAVVFDDGGEDGNPPVADATDDDRASDATTRDTGVDATVAEDATAPDDDAPEDARPETDARADGGRDAGRDGGRDAGHDGGRDAGRDGGRDAGRDAAVACDAGWTPTGSTCASVCVTGNGGCDVNASCSNGPGGRVCACRPGYTGSGVTCASNCTIANGGCDVNASCSLGVGGAVACACKPGYQGSGTTCTSACLNGRNGGCPDHSTCANVPSGVSCTCASGYARGGAKCLPVNDLYTVDRIAVARPQCDDMTGATNLVNEPGWQYSWYIIDGSGTVAKDLPFPFTLFGVRHDRYQFGVSGYVRLVTGSQNPHVYAWRPRPIPEPANDGSGSPIPTYPHDLLAPFWQADSHPSGLDLPDGSPAPTATGEANVKTFGAVGSRHFTIEWKNWQMTRADLFPQGLMRFQVKLFEGANAVEFHYCDVQPNGEDAALFDGANAVIGIESWDGERSYPYANSAAGSASTAAYLRFEPVHAARCAPGMVDCDGNGSCETNILSDVGHCGSCAATRCPQPTAGQQATGASCEFGRCAVACASGFADCNRAASDGCEVNVSNDVYACGGCYNWCSDGWAGHCTDGVCGY